MRNGSYPWFWVKGPGLRNCPGIGRPGDWAGTVWASGDPRHFLRHFAIAVRNTVLTVAGRHVARVFLDAIHDALRDSDASVLDLALRSVIVTAEHRANVASTCDWLRERVSLRPEDVALLDRIDAAMSPSGSWACRSASSARSRGTA